MESSQGAVLLGSFLSPRPPPAELSVLVNRHGHRDTPLLPVKSQRSEPEHGLGLFRPCGAGIGEQGQEVGFASGEGATSRCGS